MLLLVCKLGCEFSLRGVQEQGLETPFSKTLAMAGSLEGPETPNSVDSTVRCLPAQPPLPVLVIYSTPMPAS